MRTTHGVRPNLIQLSWPEYSAVLRYFIPESSAKLTTVWPEPSRSAIGGSNALNERAHLPCRLHPNLLQCPG
jgi:hypothetical protein